MVYRRNIERTDATTGEVLKVYQVLSPKPISKADALHAVIDYIETGKNPSRSITEVNPTQ